VSSTKGAWIVHHANKLQRVSNPQGFDNIIVAGKTGILLAAVAESERSDLPIDRVSALARANGINPLEQDSLLGRLEQLHLVRRARHCACEAGSLVGRRAE